MEEVAIYHMLSESDIPLEVHVILQQDYIVFGCLLR